MRLHQTIVMAERATRYLRVLRLLEYERDKSKSDRKA